MVKLDGHAGLSVGTEEFGRAEAAPRSRCGVMNVRGVGGAGCNNVFKGAIVDELLGGARIQQGVTVETRCGGGATMEAQGCREGSVIHGDYFIVQVRPLFG